MPNNVTSKIRIAASLSLKDLKERLGAEGDVAIDFEKIIPPPENMFRGNLGQEEAKVCAAANIPTWLDWQREHWGTKWNAYDTSMYDIWQSKDSVYTELEIRFDTAWAPPTPIIEAIRAWPEVDGICGHYVEEFAESAGVF